MEIENSNSTRLSNNYINAIVNEVTSKVNVFNAKITLACAKIEVIKSSLMAMTVIATTATITAKDVTKTFTNAMSVDPEIINTEKMVADEIDTLIKDVTETFTNAMSVDPEIINAETMVADAIDTLIDAKANETNASFAMHIANIKKIDNISIATGIELQKVTKNILDSLDSSKKISILMNNLSISSMALTQAFINASVDEADAYIWLLKINIILANAKIEAITTFFATITDDAKNATCSPNDAIAAITEAMTTNRKIIFYSGVLVTANNSFKDAKVKLENASIALDLTDIKKSNEIVVNIGMAIATAIALNKATVNIFFDYDDEDEDEDNDNDDNDDNDG